MSEPIKKRSILFVDDEPDILDGIRCTLRKERSRWNILLANGGEEALRLMKENDVDVIVSDMQMPGMSGAELLREVRNRFSSTIRIVLSGHADEKVALQAVPLAHQWLPKPSSRDVLTEAIERGCDVKDLIADSEIERIVGRVSRLPSLPRAYHALIERLEDENVSIEDLAAIVEQDPAMCARFLQVANSAFYGLPRAISEVSEAIVFLGFRMVSQLVLAAEVFETLATGNERDFSIERFQSHSLMTSRLATTLVSDLSEESSGVATAGMLHDIGSLILLKYAPELFRQCHEVAREQDIPVIDAERQVLGTTHAALGGALMAMWGLPITVADAVAKHHDIDRLPKTCLGPVGAVFVANALAHECIDGTPIAADVRDHLDQLGLTKHLEGWRVAARCLSRVGLNDPEAA